MKIDKIIYDDDEKGLQLSIAETRRVVDLLEASKEFDKSIKYLREKHCIPKNGYPFVFPKYAQEKILTQDELDKFFNEVIEITDQLLKLPYYWWSSIAYFAFYNIFFTPGRDIVEIYSPSTQDEVRLRGVEIIIKERLSKAELHKLINEEWPRIKKGMKMLHKPKKHKMIRIRWAKKIEKLRDKDKKTFKEIADILYEELIGTENEDLINEDYVKLLYHRWKIRQRKRK